jgi:6-pyruvoyl-tetrahydropterin synthase
LNLNYESPCNSIHGHSAVVKISLYSNELNKNGMVIDFKNLKDIQTHINENYDHKLLIPFDKNILINYNIPRNPFIRPLNSNHIILKKNPTAEVIATMIGKFVIEFIIVNKYTNIEKIKVEMFETLHNSATITINKTDQIWIAMNAADHDFTIKGKYECLNNKPSKDHECCCSKPVNAEIEEDDDNDQEETLNIYLLLTPKGDEYLDRLNRHRQQASLSHGIIHNFLMFCDDEYVNIPQDKGIELIMSNINYQYYDYVETDKLSFDKDVLLTCLANGYVSFSIISNLE